MSFQTDRKVGLSKKVTACLSGMFGRFGCYREILRGREESRPGTGPAANNPDQRWLYDYNPNQLPLWKMP